MILTDGISVSITRNGLRSLDKEVCDPRVRRRTPSGASGEGILPFSPDYYNPVGSLNNNYLFDEYISEPDSTNNPKKGDWGYVFVLDDHNPEGANYVGTGTLFAVEDESRITFSSDFTGGGYWRNGSHPVHYDPAGQTSTGITGSWVVSDDAFIRFTINAAGIPGGENIRDFGMSWAMSCANDIIQGWGQIAIPIPATLPLLLTGLVGFGLIGWRQRRRQH